MVVMRIVLLGCGFHGRGIAYQLARSGRVDELLVLDRDAQRAARVGSKAGVASGSVDVTDGDSLRATLVGADTVVNAVGPYHKTALGVIEAAIDAGVHYVDMNDDHEVAEAVLLDPAWDERARRAGVTVLMDCGVVPGLSGLLVRYASQQLDRTEAGRDPLRLELRPKLPRGHPALPPDQQRRWSAIHRRPPGTDGPVRGARGRQLPSARRASEVYFTGVPDPVAIARFIPGVQHATAKGAFYQDAANRLLEDMVRWGFTAYEPPAGETTSPIDYLVAYLGSGQGERYFDIPRHDLPLALRVEVEGRRSGALTTLRYEVHDHSRRATTTFTALAALAVAERELAPGVLAPEAWPQPAAFLRGLLEDRDIRVLHWRDQELPRPLEVHDA